MRIQADEGLLCPCSAICESRTACRRAGAISLSILRNDIIAALITMLQTTETLIAGLAANDETRWARFYRDYAPWIENTLLKNTPLSPPDVEDVIHETLVALVALMPAYRHDRAGKGAFHSLVLRIAQNKAYDVLRRRTRAQNRHAAFAADPAAGPSAVAEPSFTFEMSAVCLAYPHPAHDQLDADVAMPLARRRPARAGRAGGAFAHADMGGGRRASRPRRRHLRLLPPEMGVAAPGGPRRRHDQGGRHGARTPWDADHPAGRRTLQVSRASHLASTDVLRLGSQDRSVRTFAPCRRRAGHA